MKAIKIIENIDLILDEVDKPIDKAKFIISNVYHYIKAFYSDKYLISSNNFEEYLAAFKNKFKKKDISNEFSFDLFNRYKADKNINNKELITNEETYYSLLYKQLINILIEVNCAEEKDEENEKEIIESFVSLRNCFIFLEYLYLFICKNPDKINHYIIKIDISLLLDIPKKTSKRLINSEEFFYLNLIELKGLFKEIDYTHSNFINRFDNALYNKYYLIGYGLKNKKLTILKNQLYNLIMALSKMTNNNIPNLLDHIDEIYKNLSNDLNNKNANYDELIKKYIFNVEKYAKKKLKQILDEIDEKKPIENCNYLYLIAQNNFNEIKEKEEPKEEDKAEMNKIFEPKIINKDEKQINENENSISKDENIIFNKTTVINKKIKNDEIKGNEKEKLIKNEELILEIRNITEKDILELVSEEINDDKDKETKFIEKNFSYNKIFNLDKDKFYNILFFLEIYKQFKGNHIKNLDDLFSEYKNRFISLVKNLNSIDYNSFYDMISDDSFQNEIISILKSKPIYKYLNEYRYYDVINKKDKNQNEYKFSFVKEGDFFVENLSNEYNILMGYLKDDIFFTNFFRLKYLPLGIKAFVNYNLKIFVNSLHYEFNANIDDNNKNIIFRAALKIIIIHEIIHILKYLKKNDVNFNNMPETPREREGGKMFINYLFNIPVITSINLDQAIKINDINSWEVIEILRKIFPKEDELLEKNKVYNKYIDHVDLYFTEEDIEDENLKKEKIGEDIDIGIDID